LLSAEFPGSYISAVTNDESDQIIYALGERNDSCIVYAIDQSGTIINDLYIDDSLVGNNILLVDNYLYIAGVYNYFTDPRACLIKISKDLVFSDVIGMGGD
jgi:hypothetical protein